MNCIDELLLGSISRDRLNFNSCHFNFRLKQNRISIDYVEHALLNMEPLDCLNGNKKNSYELFYDAPESKCYDEIKIVVYDCNTHINVSTVMSPNESKSQKHRNSQKQDDLLRKDRAIGKAFKCN
ncbi:hypothetical protein [Methanobrevibacter sp.]|uniref:hypothetical protein n=1 Tax=Methanobrevibacter sp. TaxID=66852 RepID=UPI00388FBEC4